MVAGIEETVTQGDLKTMIAPTRPRGFVILAVILAIFSLGTIAFWIEFFTSGTVSMSDTPAYIEHEQSFPLADAYMVACALTCAVGLIRMRPWALLFGVMAGSGIIFLGLMDTLYSIQQGMFSISAHSDQGAVGFSSSVSVEAFVICAICLILGPVTIIYLWRNRARLLG